jgi:membrane protease YdiL (CAAX protease family)
MWAVLCALAVASWRLHCAGIRWSELGLRLPENIAAAVGWVLAMFLGAAVAKLAIVDPIAKAARWPPIDLSRFAKLPGNTSLFVGGLLLIWVQAAFGEEMVFRGFLLTRIELLLGAGLTATAIAVGAQALLFGAGHYYLGARGSTTAGLMGLVLGIAYVCDGRSLAPLIAAHGLADTLSLIAFYARIAPVPQSQPNVSA